MNIHFEITPEHPDTIPEVTARVQAVDRELRGFIRAIVELAVERGKRVAEDEAPKDLTSARNTGHRISDSIRITESRYAAGGAGGGGYYEADLIADSLLAPQLKYVFEGTADQGRGLIRPSHGNVLAFEKEGEGVKFRPWVHGQKPQTEWWDLAREAIESTLELEIRSMNLDDTHLQHDQ